MGISTTRSALLGLVWGATSLCTAAPDSSLPAFAQARDGSSVAAAIDLNGPWQFKATDETRWMDAVVPGVVQSDLLRVGRLKDPHYRDQELDAQWVERKEWEYRRRFRVGRDFLRHDAIRLDCRGLDTIAEVYLNERLVAKTENMHRRHAFDVKPLLRAGDNEIRIVFRSILEWNRRRIESDPRVLWCRSGELTDCGKGNVFFARKEGSDFGWDWGLRLLSSGIWRPIRLAAYDTARIAGLLVRSDLSNPRRAVLNVSAEIESFRPRPLDLEIAVTLEGKRVTSAKAALVGDRVTQALFVDAPRLWWPNGWGEHPLYEVAAVLKSGGRVVHTQRLRIGLRTVEIVRERDARGESFGIRVNGRLLFAKGANWIPADSLPDRLTEDRYRRLLDACVKANMNMIRIWGGGLYEADVLYEFCDENGLLIWQDFMFAVGPYIADEAYLESVRAEVEDVVRRLRHHPSIALWCGNNESESNMGGGQSWMKKYPTATWAEYDRIFHETIPQTALQHDPDRPYWPSSPHHPLDRAKERPDWETGSGNAHSYDVWGDGLPFSAFDQMGQYRFMAEFGYQALPDLETIRGITAPEDRYFPSYVLEHHENSGNGKTNDLGTTRIARHLAATFGMPGGLEDWVYLSQLLQADGIRRGVEALRRNHPQSTGALYWQLDDNWPVISWSSIDYHGRWKALQYLARRFFSPVLVSGVVEDSPDPIDLGQRGKVQIWGSSDLLQETPATLRWSLGRFDGTEVKQGEQEVVLPANRGMLLAELDFEKEIAEAPGPPDLPQGQLREPTAVLRGVPAAAGRAGALLERLLLRPPEVPGPAAAGLARHHPEGGRSPGGGGHRGALRRLRAHRAPGGLRPLRRQRLPPAPGGDPPGRGGLVRGPRRSDRRPALRPEPDRLPARGDGHRGPSPTGLDAAPGAGSRAVPGRGRVAAGGDGGRPDLLASGARPRVLLTAGRLAELRTLRETSHRDVFAVAKVEADAYLARPLSGRPLASDQRLPRHGQALPALALLYRLTDDPAYLEAARRWLRCLVGFDTWDGSQNLGRSSFATGVSLANDWIHDALPAEERAEARARLLRGGRILAPVVTAQHRLLSNHLHNEICALAMIGYALWGETEEAERFVAVAEEKARPPAPASSPVSRGRPGSIPRPAWSRR